MSCGYVPGRDVLAVQLASSTPDGEGVVVVGESGADGGPMSALPSADDLAASLAAVEVGGGDGDSGSQ